MKKKIVCKIRAIFFYRDAKYILKNHKDLTLRVTKVSKMIYLYLTKIFIQVLTLI